MTFQKGHKLNSGKNNPMYGKHHSKEGKNNISTSLKGKKFSQEHKDNLSKSFKGKYLRENNPHWRGGKTKHLGYNQIYSPNHPNTNNKGYVFEHRLIMEKHLNRYLTREEVVHHVNGMTDDNRIENLKLFANNSEHKRLIKE